MRGRYSILLLAAIAAHGQFRDLAVTDDGSQIYFYSDLKLKATPDRKGGIYRIVNGRLELLKEAPPSPDFIGSIQVSGDGKVLAYTLAQLCFGYSTCTYRGYPRYYTYVSARGEWLAKPLGGKGQLSRNGRYVLHVGEWRVANYPPEVYRHLLDLQTGDDVVATSQPCYHRQALTSDGRVLAFTLSFGRAAVLLLGRQGGRSFPTAEVVEKAIINDAGTWVIYETASLSGRRLRSLELSTGRDVLLARSTLSSFQASISNDGSLVLYLTEPGARHPRQMALVRPDGTGARQLGAFPDGVTWAELAGSGNAVVAVTASGRMIRVSVETGNVEEIIPKAPVYSLGATALIPGSILPIRGTDLATSTRVAPYPLPREFEGVRLLVDGQPMPLLSVSPTEIWCQVPFELPVTGRFLRYELENSSLFDGSHIAQVARRRPYFFNESGYLILAHEDFSSLVTRNHRARPEEVVHAYAVGLGPVSPEMTTGMPTPTDQLFRLVDDFDCWAGAERLEVLFAGLAPGMIGIYQVSVRMPQAAPSESIFLNCGFPGNPPDRHGGSVPFGPQAP